MIRAAAKPTPRVTLKVGGRAFDGVIRAEINRDLENIAGTYELELLDRSASAAAGFVAPASMTLPRLAGQEAIEIAIDGETVLIGWAEKVSWKVEAAQATLTLTGRDRTGDLVECQGLPEGPAEFRGIGLLELARRFCAPFGVPVSADVDLGAPFANLRRYPHDAAIRVLSDAARQRSALMTSDGVGGLLFTRSGATRGPEALVMGIGGNVLMAQDGMDWSKRFSDQYVVGQTAAPKRTACRITHASAPATGVALPALPGDNSRAAQQWIEMRGHAIDPEVTRYRPSVRVTRTQSGMTSVQEQAEWSLRVAKGMARTADYTVADWRGGPARALWRPNALVAVYNPFAAVDADMLIAGVRYEFSDQGERTTLRMVGPSAYDRINEGPRRRHGQAGSVRGAPALKDTNGHR